MKALSVRQPWAWAIVNGYKPVENRDQPTRHRGDLLIHTGKSAPEREDWLTVRRLLAATGEDPDTLPLLGAFPLGGIVGRCRLVDCVRAHPSPWFFGPVGYLLAGAVPLKLIPCRGQLHLFDVDDAILSRAVAPNPNQGALL